MRTEIYWLVDCTVKPGKLENFKAAISPLIDATRREPGNLAYDFSMNDDGSQIQIFERYANSAAIVSHVTEVFALYADDFSAGVDITRFTVYANHLEPEAKKILDGFGSTYMSPFDGYLQKHI